MTHDDVLLEAAQTIDLAQRRRFGEDASRILEGCRGNEAVGFERRLGDAEQHRRRFGRLATLFDDALVLCLEIEPVDLIAPEQATYRPDR